MNIKKYKQFIDSVDWIFAKTYKDKAPHEYVLKNNLSDKKKELFDDFIKYIKENGYVEYFYKTPYTYLDVDDKKYWVMEEDLSKVDLINRTEKKNKY